MTSLGKIITWSYVKCLRHSRRDLRSLSSIQPTAPTPSTARLPWGSATSSIHPVLLARQFGKATQSLGKCCQGLTLTSPFHFWEFVLRTHLGEYNSDEDISKMFIVVLLMILRNWTQSKGLPVRDVLTKQVCAFIKWEAMQPIEMII